MSKRERNIWRAHKIIYDYLLPINFFGCLMYILWLLTITGLKKSFAVITTAHFIIFAIFIIMFPILKLICYLLEKELNTERNKSNDRENK